MNQKVILFIRFFIPLCVGIILFGMGITLLEGASFFGVNLLTFFLIEKISKKTSLLSLNTLILGLMIGLIFGVTLLAIFNILSSFSTFTLPPSIHIFLSTLLFSSALYCGVLMTLKGASEIALSIPFVRFYSSKMKTKKILVDPSILCDPRLLDLVSSGLLDQRLVIPDFVVKELQELSQSKDENTMAKGKLALETLKKLEAIPELGLKNHALDFDEIKEVPLKIIKLCRLLEADLLTSDLTKAQSEGVRIINLNTLASLLKPLMQRGEYLNVKIQRYGKEELQGVGYLEDGTMIVVNGGGEFIGQTIRASVLSIKQTSTGRIIFCNVAENFVGINV